MAKHIGVIGVVLDQPQQASNSINVIISENHEIVVGRMGIPRCQASVGVLALIVEGEEAALNAMVEKLKKVPGVTVSATSSPM